ncbi:transcriptional regulator [Elizabethkingia argentiflava]|uniref:Transcriptional regulator n=1 Tax=Elizabethkingia argenteiflava TaxID=2681556 RepID=A0A845PV93_9FLAO|nr:helix-turn-helix domain-containing protein [Elizabethkingia argenteiflava]NAW52142.1 transcriptional regulator [Elizabethkingia argenteiflava]
MMTCDKSFIMALKDSLNVVNGKWKLAIICVLLNGKRRFSDIQNAISNISPRMVSKELKELEINGVIKRKVTDCVPVLIEYELTPSGQRLNEVIEKMVEWGIRHREDAVGETIKPTKP